MDIIGILVLVISFFFLLVVGVPVAYSIGVAGILTMLVNIDSLPALTTYAMRMASGLDSFALLAIPFFILAGNIMNSGGIALRLIDFAKVLVGRLPGGLAVVNVVANMLFGAISGSAAAAASAIGSIMTPEMKKAGYDPNFSAAVNISSRLVYGWLSTGNSYGSGDHDRSRYVCRTKGVSGWRTCSVLGGDKGIFQGDP